MYVANVSFSVSSPVQTFALKYFPAFIIRSVFTFVQVLLIHLLPTKCLIIIVQTMDAETFAVFFAFFLLYSKYPVGTVVYVQVPCIASVMFILRVYGSEVGKVKGPPSCLIYGIA